MKANRGQAPAEAIGKRVNVRMRIGWLCAGWRTETTRWTLQGSPFDVLEYEVVA